MMIIAVINVNMKLPHKNYDHDDHFGSYCMILPRCHINNHYDHGIAITGINSNYDHDYHFGTTHDNNHNHHYDYHDYQL